MKICAKSYAYNIRVSAQKCRLVADLIRGLKVDKALTILQFEQKKSTIYIQKVLMSAIANAENNFDADVDSLYVQHICIDKGPSMKRFSARAKGRGDKIEKQTCHINVAVGY